MVSPRDGFHLCNAGSGRCLDVYASFADLLEGQVRSVLSIWPGVYVYTYYQANFLTVRYGFLHRSHPDSGETRIWMSFSELKFG